MANMFPIRSDIGNARIDTSGPDPMFEAIEASKNLTRWNDNRTRGITPGVQQVGSMVRGNTQPPQGPQLRFGGVVGDNSNPGADIMARASQNAERIYQGYKQPVNEPMEPGLSNDEAHLERYFNRKNKETLADASADNASNKGWKTVTIADPNDPTKQINAQVNDRTGETRPIELPGNIVKTGSAKDMQTTIDNRNKASASRESHKTKAQEALNLLNELQDEKTGGLNPDVQTATGYSANVPFLEKMPFGYGTSAATGNAKLDRLQGMLTLDLIKELKDQSKTGATGFGALNMKELGVLENSASMLGKRNMEEGEYAKHLGEIRNRLKMILQDEPSMNPVASHNSNVNAGGKPQPKEVPGYEWVRRPDNKGWTAIKKLGK
jgi:hypothetical protein